MARLYLAALVLACCATGLSLANIDTTPDFEAVVEGSYIIVLKPDVSLDEAKMKKIEQDMNSAVSSLDVSTLSVKMLHNVGMVLLRGIPSGDSISMISVINAIGNEDIESISPDRIAYAAQSCPQQPATWGIDRIDQTATTLDDTFTTPGCNMGEGVDVYVLDTGIRMTHNEFQDSGTSRATQGFSAFGDDSSDVDGHGTHCAGTVGGITLGVAKKVGLVSVKVLNDQGSGSYSGIIDGINWVIGQVQSRGRRGVISMSLGGGKSDGLNNAVANAVDNHDIPVIVAAGNSNADACNYSPASEPRAYTVGSTTSQDARSGFSNHGTCVDIFAPGSSILSAGVSSDSSQTTMSGTSMATPHVAGVAALILSSNSTKSVDEVYAALSQSAIPVSLSGANGAPQILLNVQSLDVQGCSAPQDCVFGEWSAWSGECPALTDVCGEQTRSRSRSVSTLPRCGGALCANGTETQDCQDVLNGQYPACPDLYVLDFLAMSTDFSQLSFHELVFDPRDQSSSFATPYYSMCIQSATSLVEHTPSRTEINNPQDDSSTLAFSQAVFPWYGETVTVDLYFGSNGFISLNESDSSYSMGSKGGQDEGVNAESVYNKFFISKRISPLMVDLAPNNGGKMIYEKMSSPNRLVFTYQNISYFGDQSSDNTLQVVIHTDTGRIRFIYAHLDSRNTNAFVGLSDAEAAPSTVTVTDLPGSGECSSPPPPPPPPSASPSPPPSSGSSPPPPGDPTLVEYEYVRVNLTGESGLTFAGLQAFSLNGTNLPLQVSSSSTPYGVGKYWSAEASIDRDATTCFAAAWDGQNAGETQTGFITYRLATPAQIGAIRITNDGPCGPSPNAFNGSLQSVSVSASADGVNFVEALPSTTISQGESTILGMFQTGGDTDLRYRPPFYGLSFYRMIIGDNTGENGRTIGYEFQALTTFKVVGMGIGIQSKRFNDKSILPFPLKISLWEVSSYQRLNLLEIPEGSQLINEQQVEGFIPPGQEVELQAGKNYVIEVEDSTSADRKKRFQNSSIRIRKLSGSDYNSGLIKLRRGRIGDTPGSFPTQTSRKTIFGIPYMLFDTASLSSSDFTMLMEGPQVNTTSEVLEDETEKTELRIAASLSTVPSFTCSDECACDCQETYDDGDDDDDDDYDDYDDIE